MKHNSNGKLISNESEVSESSSSITSADRVVQVACACDDNYAMPLAVTLSSAAEQLDPDWSLNVHLLDGGISPANREKLRQTFDQHGIAVNWIEADFSDLDDLSISHHISHVAYYRLLLSRILPLELDRVLYLDSDLLVQSSIHQIWQREFKGNSLFACIDIACPYIDAAKVPRSRKARPWLAVWRPIPNYKQLGIAGDALYFNSGVLLIDLHRWRAESTSRKLIDALRENQKYVWCWDQYALNVVLAGDWHPLPPTWNQGAHVFEFPSSDHSPIATDEFVAMRDNPDIVHFTTEWKPWHFRNDHPFRQHFFHALDKTAWAGWKPDQPRFSIKDTWQNFAVGMHKRTAVAWRKLVNVWTKDA